MSKNLNCLHPRDRFLSRWARPGVAQVKADVSRGTERNWGNERQRSHTLPRPAWPSPSPRCPIISADKLFCTQTTKLNLATVFYLGLCPLVFFFLNQIFSEKKKNSVQGKTGIKPKTNQVSALSHSLTEGILKFLYVWSLKRSTHLAVAWTVVISVSKWACKK